MDLTKEYFDQQLKGLASKADLDHLKTFIQSNVALKADINALKTGLPNREDFSQLQSSVDGLATLTKDYYEEMTVLQDAAPKLGLKYEV